MARIANKKTGKLTKQYRDPSVFHASSRRRSYRRKGTSTRRKRTSYATHTTVNDPGANAIASVIVGGGFLALLMWLLPIFVSIVVGCILLWGVDKICKSKWNLPSGKWSMPASWGWTILTGIEMIVSFFIVLFIVIEEATITALVINLIVYVGLSAWILISKHNKIMNASTRNYKSDMVQEETYSSDAYDATLSLDDDDEAVDDDYIDAEEEAAKKLCAKLKSNVVVCSEFWDEMHLTFKYNLVTSYTSLQLNFEIKNSSGVPWYDGGGGITVKANVYDVKGNLLCIEDTYIEDNELTRNRYTDYLYFDFDDVKKAAKIEIDAYQED